MEATQNTEAAAPAAPLTAPREAEPSSQPAPVAEQQSQPPAPPAQQPANEAQSTGEENKAPEAPQPQANTVAQAAQGRIAPRVIPRDKYSQQSLGVSLNARIKQVRRCRAWIASRPQEFHRFRGAKSGAPR